MTATQKLLELKASGDLKILYDAGWVSFTADTYANYYMKFLEYRDTGNGKMDSYQLVADDFGISNATVREAIKRLKNPKC